MDIKSDIIWRRIMRLADVTSLEEFVSGWFQGAPFPSVRRGNMEDFIAYGFYGKRFRELDAKVCCLMHVGRCTGSGCKLSLDLGLLSFVRVVVAGLSIACLIFCLVPSMPSCPYFQTLCTC